MDKNCPSCGNKKNFIPTLVSDSYLCEECGSEFSESTNEVYTAPNYKVFCEKVIKGVRSELNDAIIATAIGELTEGYLNDGQEYAKDFIAKLSEIASDLYMDHKRGMREKYDFLTIMEGVEKLIEFYNLQNPQDETFAAMENEEEEEEAEEEGESEVEAPSSIFGDADDVNEVDPSSMVDANAAPAEKIEHTALAILQSNVKNLKKTLELLDAAEQQELEDGSEEGEDHEEKEAKLMADLKDATEQLQTALTGYLDNESNAHYNAPTLRNKVDEVIAGIANEMLGESVASLKVKLLEICSEACQMLDECGYPVSEDAQLVTQDHLDNQLAQSIDTNTAEMGNLVDEAVIGGQNIDPALVGPEGSEPPSIEDMAAANDIEEIPVDGEFKKNQNVIFEDEVWVITGFNEGMLILENSKGETAETDADSVILSNKEDCDVVNEQYERGTNDLRKAWESIEESINQSKSLMKPVRRFDLREAIKPPIKGAVRLPAGVGPSDDVDVGARLPMKVGNKVVDPNMDYDQKDRFIDVKVVKKNSPKLGVFEVIRIEATPKNGGDSKVYYDAVGMSGKYYLRKSTRGNDGKDIVPPKDIVNAGTKDNVINGILDAVNIDHKKANEISQKLDTISSLREMNNLPNSNIAI